MTTASARSEQHPRLVFQSTSFDIADRNGQHWLRASQIGKALGYIDDKSIQRIYKRHADEFTDSMTGVVKLTTPSGEQESRIFSLRGAHLIAMFARTAVAKQFRRWVLDVLERTPDAVPGPAPLLPAPITAEEYDKLQAVMGRAVALLPTDNRSAAKKSLSAAIRAKFDVELKDLPREHLTDAVAIIGGMAAEWVLVDDKERKVFRWKHSVASWQDKDGTRTVKAVQKLIGDMQEWALDALPGEQGAELWAALRDLNGLVMTGWTHVDEALMQITAGTRMLHRWQGRNGRMGNVAED